MAQHLSHRSVTSAVSQVFIKSIMNLTCLPSLPAQVITRQVARGYTTNYRTTWPDAGVPANTRQWTNDSLMLGQRLRRWPYIKPSLVGRVVFALIADELGPIDLLITVTEYILSSFGPCPVSRHSCDLTDNHNHCAFYSGIAKKLEGN